MALITVNEVARRREIARQTVMTWIQQGKLPAQKLGRDWLIDEAHLEKIPQRKPGRPRKQQPPSEQGTEQEGTTH